MDISRIMLERDTANHFVYGALACVLGGMWLCALVAVGKEAYDYISGKGEASMKDAVATIAGGICVFLGASHVFQYF
jgi:hypothetical protein